MSDVYSAEILTNLSNRSYFGSEESRKNRLLNFQQNSFRYSCKNCASTSPWIAAMPSLQRPITMCTHGRTLFTTSSTLPFYVNDLCLEKYSEKLTWEEELSVTTTVSLATCSLTILSIVLALRLSNTNILM